MAFAYLRTLVTSFLSPAKEIQATNAAVEVARVEGLTERQGGDSGAYLPNDLEMPQLSLSGDCSTFKPDPSVFELCCRRIPPLDVVYIDDEQVEKYDRRMRHRSRRIKSKERDLEIDAARRAKRQPLYFA